MPISKIFNAGIWGDSLAIIAGIALTFAFAPFSLFPLAILSPALLLAVWLKVTTRQAFWRGWLFGLGFFTSGVYWIFISVHDFGNAAMPVAGLITGAFIAVLALFPALNGYFLNRYFKNNSYAKILYAFPAIWVVLEWIRSWIFSGFPWLFLGYSQINSPLKGYAPILSVYGVSLAVALSAALLINTLKSLMRAKYKAFYFSLFALTFIWALGSVLSFIPWTKPDGPLIKISLVQGNIPQSLKWSPEQVKPTLERYQKLTDAHWDSRIIIWPESAVPLILQNAEDFIDTLSEKANEHHTAIITGIPIESDVSGSYYNAVITVGNGAGIYTKQHLVPFGEYTPLSGLFKHFFTLLDIPMSDFIAGPNSFKPIEIQGIKIATFICYEIAFPEQVRGHNENVGMILTVSNDAWFGRSVAQAQHLEMGQMRALEMGRPVLFVSNNGITAFINPTGKIQSIAPPFETTVLTDAIQAYTGKTPWQWAGMDPILLILVFMLFVAIRRRNK
jgi:apolipoprotein N-acyltransferase